MAPPATQTSFARITPPEQITSLYTSALSASNATINSLLTPSFSTPDSRAQIRAGVKDRGQALLESISALLEDTTRDDALRDDFHRTAKAFIAAESNLRAIDHNMEKLVKQNADTISQTGKLVSSLEEIKGLSASLRLQELVQPAPAPRRS